MMQLECSHNDDITREPKLLWIIFYKIKDARFLGKKPIIYKPQVSNILPQLWPE